MRNLANLILIVILFFSCKGEESEEEKSIPVEKITNVEKPRIKNKESTFLIENLYGIWAENLDGPHADFELTKKSFYIVDYDGNGDLSYEITDNKIKVFYPDFVKTGLIKKAQNDSLIIYWQNGEQKTYLRWKE